MLIFEGNREEMHAMMGAEMVEVTDARMVEEMVGGWMRRWASSLLTVNSCIKVRLDLQADKSPVVVRRPFFPRVVNPRYLIRGTNV
jgi:hypothetical protein